MKIFPWQHSNDSVVDTAQSIGQWGESIASKYLANKGYRIVGHNFRSGKGEVDLVARQGSAIVFVEVRTRKFSSLVPPHATINKRKRDTLRRTCLAYVALLHKKPQLVRFDVIAISYQTRAVFDIAHYENVPLFKNGFYTS
jgi:putative endonuclease